MVSTAERIKTNWLLIDDLNMWDDFSVKSLQSESQERKYYDIINNIVDQHLRASVDWMKTPEARRYFFAEAEYTKELFESLENEWDRILSGKYDTIDELLGEIYNTGKRKGYSDIRSRVRFTDADRLALTFAKTYNYGLIKKLSNDLRHDVKNKIIKAAIGGENPNQLANDLLKLGIKPLKGSTLSAKQRATMIAKTETSRIQNTGILQSYVNEGYTQVTILTAEDDNVCYTCLKISYEFNKDSEIIYSNHIGERTHNIRTLLRKGIYPPFHPNCRCTVLPVWETKSEPPKNPYTVVIIPSSYDTLSGLFNSAIYDEKAEFSDERLPQLHERTFEEKIKGFVDESDIKLLTKFLKSFISQVPNVYYEFGAANLFGSISLGFGDWEGEVEVPNVVKIFGKKFSVPILIHNHPFRTSPFASPKDFRIYAEYGVHYGIVTNDFGTFIVKNNDIKGNMDNFGDI